MLRLLRSDALLCLTEGAYARGTLSRTTAVVLHTVEGCPKKLLARLLAHLAAHGLLTSVTIQPA